MAYVAPEMDQLRIHLHQALSLAEKSVEPVAWAYVAQALGYVCQRLRLHHSDPDECQLPAATLMAPSVPVPFVEIDQRQILKENLIEMLTRADELDEPAIAIHLNQALYLLTGYGMPLSE